MVVSDSLARGCGADSQPDPQQWRALAPGVHVLSCRQFFSGRWGGVPGVADVFESLAAVTSGESSGVADGATTSARPHWEPAEIEAGIAQGTVITGTLKVSSRDPSKAVVTSSALGAAGVQILGRAAMNRAMHGDTVAVHILPPDSQRVELYRGALVEEVPGDDDEAGDDFAASAGRATDMDTGFMGAGADEVAEAAVSGAGGEDDGFVEANHAASGQVQYGEVVAVLQRSGQEVVCSLSPRDEAALRQLAEQEASVTVHSVLCVPTDRRLPRVRLHTRQAARLLSQRLVVRVDGWDPGSKYPHAHLLRVLGPAGDLRSETDAVLVSSGIRWQPFTEAALRELPSLGGAPDGRWALSAREESAELAAGRRDLRGDEYFIVSIDPPGCTDVDDAMHARFIDQAAGSPDKHAPLRSPPQSQQSGTAPVFVEVGVHIADVSYFVRQSSALDAEAAARCTTVYLVDRRLDMLPSAISEDAASLLAGRDRLAVSVVWTLRADALAQGRVEVVSVWCGRTLIRSRHQLEYQQAQDVLDGNPLSRERALPAASVARLLPVLRVLSSLATALRTQRLAHGAVELESAELRFQLNADGAPTGVTVKSEIPMMTTVAEMMIFANAAVAERVHAAAPRAALLRCHAPPKPEWLEEVTALCTAAGAPLDLPSGELDPAALGPALRAACAAAPPDLATLIKATATRAMSEAQYLCSGAAGVLGSGNGTGLGHFGLALPYYTHFTSPIRRYADVIVHRQLLEVLQMASGGEGNGFSHGKSSGEDDSALVPREVTGRAAVMNDRHRGAKRAQKSCADLFLLLLLHSKPHAERALISEVRGTVLHVFVPKYHTKVSFDSSNAAFL